ncbi:MAG: fructose-6-phosphate aldolase [Candidatus Thermoplasmatota archaeon]|jgi:transaldolase|nr:fructose-6-phosphate aldolase [Candidatus Thermoplasmatota archaeon]
MKLFLDTASVKEIRTMWEIGILDGVTTNPTLVAKEGRKFEEVLREICALGVPSVSAEVVATDVEGMLREGRHLRGLHPSIYVKVPMTPAGLQATKTLASEGTRVNMTLVFSANQALLAAKVGAAYVSPFIGRLDDQGEVGMELIRDIVAIYSNYRFSTEILVASVRHPVHVLEAAKLGAHIATMPYAVMEKLVQHPLTDLGLARFLKDWEKVPRG